MTDATGRGTSCWYCSQRLDLPNPECPKSHLHEASGRGPSREQERLRVEMRECLLPEYAFLADVVADLTLNPEGHVTWLAMSAPEEKP